MWIAFAFGSALFAGLTSVLAKCGIKNTDSDVATAIRTIVVLIFAWIMVWIVGSAPSIVEIGAKTWVFLILSGLATGASWLCYFRALQTGDVNKVVPIDKSSTILTIILAFVFLGEPVTFARGVAVVLIGLGTYLMIEKRGAGEGDASCGDVRGDKAGEGSVGAKTPNEDGSIECDVHGGVEDECGVCGGGLTTGDSSSGVPQLNKPAGFQPNKCSSCSSNSPLKSDAKTWLFFAVLSAVFAALTSILGKVGIEGVESNLGTAIRTVVVLVMAWVVVFVKGKHRAIKFDAPRSNTSASNMLTSDTSRLSAPAPNTPVTNIPTSDTLTLNKPITNISTSKKELAFICLSGVCTGASWLCYYRALQDGLASVVVPIDKLSILVSIGFGAIVFKERLTKRSATGLLMIVAGTLLMFV